jgi:sigma-E factor negative regulatory protein RseA
MIDKERLSALVDNENIDAVLLDELGKDESLSSSWQHYHMIGDVMRGETPKMLDLDLTSAIMDAIAQEPVHNVRKNSVRKDNVRHEAVRQESANDSSFYQKFVQPWLKVGGQLAIAASVTMVVITGVQYSNSDAPSTPGFEPALNVMPFAGMAAPVSLSIESPDTRQVKHEFTDEEKVKQVRRINAFVLDHQLQKRIQ